MHVIGIDPGGRCSGLVLRDGKEVLSHAVVEHGAASPDAAYLDRVVSAVAQMTDSIDTYPVIAVEGLTHPNPHLGLANVTGLLGAAMVLGAVLYAYADAIVVPPGGHGSRGRNAYPPVLIGEREGPALAGKLRHARSAYDVAGAAALIARSASG